MNFVAGIVKIPNGFEVVGESTKATIGIKAPDGKVYDFDVPLQSYDDEGLDKALADFKSEIEKQQGE